MGRFEELWVSGGGGVLEKTRRQEMLWARLLGISEEVRGCDLEKLCRVGVGGVLDSGCVALCPPEGLVREWGSRKFVCGCGVEIWWVPGYPGGFWNTAFAMLERGVVRVEDLGMIGHGDLMEEYQVWVYCQRKGESGDG